MAKERLISTKFWHDGWVRKINPLDRYLFIFLLTNEYTNLSGIYEMPTGTIAFHTGLDERDLKESMLPKLEPKVYYFNEYVILVNFPKHQRLNNQSIVEGILRELSLVPPEVLKYALDKGYFLVGRDDVPVIPPSRHIPNLTKLNQTKPIASDLSLAWSLEEKLEEMESKPNSYLDVIATFIREKPVKVENSRQLSGVIARYCRVAKKLAGAYTNEQIFKAAEKIRKSMPDVDWTLETIYKQLTK